MTIEEFEYKINQIAKDVIQIDNSLLITNDVRRQMMARIFNVKGGQDVKGKILPKYKSEYYRKKKKKVATNWDLQDSLALSKSIKVVHEPSKKQCVVSFTDEVDSNKAKYLEETAKIKIFEASQEEIDKSVKLGADVIIKEMLKRINNIFAR